MLRTMLSVLVLVAVCARADEATNPPQADTCGLRARLRALPPRDGFPRYALTLTNGGKQPLRLVLPGDGSSVAWRTPVITWLATAGGKPAPAQQTGRCGMMNAVEEGEIFTLSPGASREIIDWLGHPDFASGSYELRLRYRNEPALQTSKGGSPPELAQKLAQTSACDVTSNALKVTIQRPAEQ